MVRRRYSPETGFTSAVFFAMANSHRNRYGLPHMQWYYSKNGTQLGPVAEAELMAKLASREVLPTDLVWKDGMGNWLPVSNVPELAQLSAFPGAKPGVPPGVNTFYSSPASSAAYAKSVLAPPTSGLAIASLVCGIMGLVTCLMLPGIPAVTCGNMAISRMNGPGVLSGGRGMAIAGLVMGDLSILCIVGFVVVILMGSMAGFIH